MANRARILAAGLLFLAAQVRAEGGMPPGGGGGEPGMHGAEAPERILKQLDLSDTQKEKIKSLRRARRDKNQQRMNAAKDAGEDLRELLGKTDRSKGYEEKLRAKHAEVVKLMTELGDERFEAILEIRSILTDEQLKKFVELSEKQGPMGRMGGKGMRGRGHKGGRDGEGRDGHDHEGRGDHDDDDERKDSDDK